MKNKNLAWFLIALVAIVIIVWMVRAGQNNDTVISTDQPAASTTAVDESTAPAVDGAAVPAENAVVPSSNDAMAPAATDTATTPASDAVEAPAADADVPAADSNDEVPPAPTPAE